MKKFGLIIVLALMAVSCQEQQKIGYIDNGKVINDYQEKKDIEEKYKGKDEVFSKRADSISNAFQLEAQDFNIKAKRMSPKKAQEMYEELGNKQQLLQQQLQFEQQQLQQAFNAEIDSVIVKVKEYVEDYGQKNGYTFILGTSDVSSSVMYGADANNLTEEVLEGLNASYTKQ